MDENGVRTLLRDLADTATPPARVDLRQAMAAGRRHRRFRLAGAAGSALAVGAAIGVAVTMAVAVKPGTATPRASATAQASLRPTTVPSTQPTIEATARPTAKGTSSPRDVPAQFDALRPYASFGWLPAGFTTVIKDYDTTSNDSTALAANGRGTQGSFWLHVMSTGACSDSGTIVNCHWDSGDVTGPLSLAHRAPDVNGRPAYWTEGNSILWEYAPRAWATMVGPYGYDKVPSAAVRTLILKVASGVRYGYQTPLAFPFWLSGLPASWGLSDATFTDTAPPLYSDSVDLGPSLRPQAAYITITPPSGPPGCQFSKGYSRYVTLDGVKAIVNDGSSIGTQSLCISNLNGQLISIMLIMRLPGSGTPVPGAASIGGVIGLFRHLHLLGTDPAGWTTNPLR